MRDSEYELKRIYNGSLEEREDAAWGLARSGKPDIVRQLFAFGDSTGDPSHVVRRGLLQGLIDGAPATLGAVFDEYERDPMSERGGACAYVLGEIAYRQGPSRDPRILTHLVTALARYASEGSNRVFATVAALRECARSGSIPSASDPLRILLERARFERDPYFVCLDNALAVLHINGGSAFVDEAEKLLGSLPTESRLAIAIDEFLSTIRGNS